MADSVAFRSCFVVVEIDQETLQPQSPTSLFAWDGGTVFATVEDAQAEALDANEAAGGAKFSYRVAEVRLLPEDAQP